MDQTSQATVIEELFSSFLQPDLSEEEREEHSEVKEMLADMLGMDFDDEGFDARFTSLMKAVQHHVEEEEGFGRLSPTLREKWPLEVEPSPGRPLKHSALGRPALKVEATNEFS